MSKKFLDTTSTASTTTFSHDALSDPVFNEEWEAFQPSDPASFATVPPAEEKWPRRRQNSSCDQCRAGKRGCDLQIKTVNGTTSHEPCSSCKRWKKTCTTEWISAKRRCSTAPTTATVQSLLGNGNPSLLEPIDCFSLAPSLRPAYPSLVPPVSDQCSAQPQADAVPWTTDQLCQPLPAQAPFSFTSYSLPSRSVSYCTASDTKFEVEEDIGKPASSDAATSRALLHVRDVRKRHRSPSPEEDFKPAPTKKKATFQISPFISNLLSEDQTRFFIKKGLLKIYHDSMEGALSCWLTERNCPYALSKFDSTDAWGSNWSNRIAKRVCALDDAYAKTGALSTADRRQASKVLNLAITAFAAQWAQAGPRSDARLSSDGGSSTSSESPPDGLPHNDLFGREMQQSLWHNARRALADASANPSFKVIFAGIIFALTQRPMNASEFESTQQADDLTALDELLEFDGPPIYLDIALRKLHDHQRRLFSGSSNRKTKQVFSEENPKTFGFLYWLAVMFDTISAAMNRRAVIVNDSESDLNRDITPENGYSDLWGNYFLSKQSRNGDSRKPTTRWPCSYKDAACCLADAAPVKILLWRRVGRFQDLLYQHATADQLQEAAHLVLEVYQYWNSSYGIFISDCIEHHETLPARIQSWYILLTGHWHLSVFIFADLLDKLESCVRSMSLQFNGSSMTSAEVSAALRVHSVCMVSELGRCSRYGETDLSFSLAPEFHHAVNKAALLTEPWTVVLVRVFGKAGQVLIKQIQMQRELELVMYVEDALQETRRRLQYCIDALWLLGKKSDMAMCAGSILQRVANNT
ncbi:Regulatory protein alcR [Teratosphaeria destructans]|uniref:Regulatory protein alcR n=1 Tax=Teratosphaeria destructans TaxID=418781 RepID=A0A9W7SQW6_9PEZI|nr:Regulatory protein alcR [Teratosphaeria destructans]